MRKARKQSWNSAKLLWALKEKHGENTRNKIDYFVLKLSEHIKSPKSIAIRLLLKIIQKIETKEVGAVISELKAD